MKKIILFFLLSIAGSLIVSAQPMMPDKIEVFYPHILLSSTVLTENQAMSLADSDDFGQKREPRNKKHWDVFSDRDNNVTYEKPDGLKPYSSLSFGDKLRIAKLSNGYALVYEEPQEDIPYPLYSQDVVCKGWVSMDKLLIWHYSPANESGIYNKALLCENLDKTGNNSDKGGKLYRNPDDRNRFEKMATDMKFYFIMKREGGLSLLAENHSMDGLSSDVLYGWVSESSYVAWNQRSCLEPTWNKKDVEWFADEKVVVDVYAEVDGGAVAATDIEFVRTNSTERDPEIYRWAPEILRYPILDGGTDEYYRCSTFGPADGATVIQVGGEKKELNTLAYTNEKLNEMLHINIGIVIDGTRSMEPFYPAVKEALKEGIRYFNDNYTVKVGVVIYRDYSDGEFVTERLSLTSGKSEKIGQFLDKGGFKGYGIRSAANDRTLEEALYVGINEAVDKLGFKPEQSNLLIVIGDCGNARNDTRFTHTAIVDKLVEKDINVIGIQVQRGEEDAYELFNEQLAGIVSGSMTKRYKKLKENINVKFDRTEDGYKLVNDEKFNLYVGSVSKPMGDQGTMPIERLAYRVRTDIGEYADAVQTQINLVTKFQSGGWEPSKSDKGGIGLNEAWLRNLVGDERFEEYQKNNTLLAFKGFTYRKHKSGRNFWKPIVFISSDELNSLLDRLKDVNAAAGISNNREPYVKAMKALVESMTEGHISDAEINKMTPQAIMAKVAGLNESTAALGEYSIIDIGDPTKVPHDKYAALVSSFRQKYQNLERIRTNSEYKYVRDFNRQRYYWLPVEALP